MSRLLKNRNLETVDTWYTTPYAETNFALKYVFDNCSLFNNIWIPVKEVNSNGMTADAIYQNIGLTSDELTILYESLYKENYIVTNYVLDGNKLSATSMTDLCNRVTSVLNMNKYKYLKLIELSGYTYNPLWNVDGTEDFTYLDNDGGNETNTQYIRSEYTDHGTNTIGSSSDTNIGNKTHTGGETTSNTHNDINSVTSFDSENWSDSNKNEGSSTTTVTNNNVTDSDNSTQTHSERNDTNSLTHGGHTDNDIITTTHKNALNNGAEYSGGIDTYGNNVIGCDKYHTERRVRSGNIGVTKTQELIESERKNLKFSIIGEFFKDLNEQILVGIY